MAGWPSGFRAQTGYVACDVIRCLGEAAAPRGGLRALPRLCIEYNTSEISSSGEVGFWVGTTRLGVLGLAAAVLALAAAFF